MKGAIFLALSLSVVVPAAPPEGWVQVWGDDFNAKELNDREWIVRTDSKLLSTQVPENISLCDGLLVLTGRKQEVRGKGYTGAGIISRREFTHGYFEARMKYPKGAGWHGSFWLQMHDGLGGTGPSKTLQEMDIVETDTYNLTHYSTSIHRWNPLPVKMSVGGHAVVTTPDLSLDFHTWGCLWGEQETVMTFDGRPVLTAPAKLFPQGPQQVWLTMIGHDAGKHPIDNNQLPAEMTVDYVRVFAMPLAR